MAITITGKITQTGKSFVAPPPVPVLLGDIGVYAGGWIDEEANVSYIDYVTISTLGDAQDFSNLDVAKRNFGATSNGALDRGIFMAGKDSAVTNIVSYITISSPVDGANFGEMGVGKMLPVGLSNGANDRGLNVGGQDAGAAKTNTINYVTISSQGNSTVFGYVTNIMRQSAATSNATNERGLIIGGHTGTLIDYVTISSLGNAIIFGNASSVLYTHAAASNGTNDHAVFGGVDIQADIWQISLTSLGNSTTFGNLTLGRQNIRASSNGINDRAIFSGGYWPSTPYDTIDYVTITSAGAAEDFGNLRAPIRLGGATSNA